MEQDKEEEMSNNNSSNAITGILLALSMILGMWIFSIVKPILSSEANTKQEVVRQVEEEPIKETPSHIFYEYDSIGSTITIKSYTDGIIFESNNDLKVSVLANDMGFILTPINKDGIAIGEPYEFIGEGWHTLQSKPTIQSPSLNESLSTANNEINTEVQ